MSDVVNAGEAYAVRATVEGTGEVLWQRSAPPSVVVYPAPVKLWAAELPFAEALRKYKVSFWEWAYRNAGWVGIGTPPKKTPLR